MPQPRACTAYNRAIEYYEAGELDKAICEAESQLSKDGDDGRLWELLGMLAYAKRDFSLAQSAIEQATVLIPLSARGQLVLGKCYDRSRYRETAAAIYRHVARQSQLASDLLEPLASGLGHCGEFKLALNVCQQAARRTPKSAVPLVGIAYYMRRLGRPIESILPTLARAHRLEPENVEYRISLAWMLHELGRSDDGASLLEQLTIEDFSCIRCLTRMQHIFDSAGDDDRAEKCRTRLMIMAASRGSEGADQSGDCDP